MPITLETIAIWVVQSTLVIAIAAVAEGLLRTARPIVRLAYWRAVWLLCLALPLLASPRLGALPPAVMGRVDVVATFGQVAPAIGLHRFTEILPWILGVGIVARLLWLYAGAVRLATWRRQSTPALLDEDAQVLKAMLAPEAELRWCDRVNQPVTFGMHPPVILLPRRFADLKDDARRAVTCHELLHVSRRDWPAIVVEEHARAVFWYHPAVWWLLSRLDLCREQVVDEAVVHHTGSRRTYMRALLAFADTGSAAVPSLAFLRRRHLHARLRQLSKEPAMSTRHLVGTIAALLLVMGGATTAIATALPMPLPGPGRPSAQAAGAQGGDAVVAAQDTRVTTPVPIRQVRPSYTPEAMARGIEGTVRLEAVVNTDGTVSDTRVVRSLDSEYGLDDQAVAAVRQWRFAPGQRDGKPVPVLVVMEMEFIMRSDRR